MSWPTAGLLAKPRKTAVRASRSGPIDIDTIPSSTATCMDRVTGRRQRATRSDTVAIRQPHRLRYVKARIKDGETVYDRVVPKYNGVNPVPYAVEYVVATPRTGTVRFIIENET